MRQVVCLNINDENGEAADDFKCVLAEAKRRMKNLGKRLRRRRKGKSKPLMKLRKAGKPKTKQKCNKHPCPFKWVPGDWSQVYPIKSSIQIYADENKRGDKLTYSLFLDLLSVHILVVKE